MDWPAIILLTLLLVSNWMWSVIFTGYRQGVKDAIEHHMKIEHRWGGDK